MSRSVRDNPINLPYPPKADFTLVEAEQRIAISQAAIATGCRSGAAGECLPQASTICPPVSAIDIAKIEQLVPSSLCA
ncbi:hypothetical protein KTQ42_23120 [Noviherbaspirillum sp. L7-7A]|uniref:hypothetical protein n=1 Tax=Noviherbaspirillum sp. L7-7A TaxID=2850560 RepID=UPI001C2C9676|nr:hypothetical protein [Noviherbaspirillum sp. L7-7A]MBV0882171.1 hypothetical protein [Noviherbaspirillum sp. L7-7A]